MARPDIQVRAAATAVRRSLHRLIDEVDDVEPLLGDMGAILVRTTKSRFYKQVTPTGRPWKKSKLARKQRRKTLILSERLLRSVEALTANRELQIGSDVRYAGAHQKGAWIRPGPRARSRTSTGIALSVDLRIRSTGQGRVRLRARQRRYYAARDQNKARSFRIDRRPFVGVSKSDRAALRELLKRRAEANWK